MFYYQTSPLDYFPGMISLDEIINSTKPSNEDEVMDELDKFELIKLAIKCAYDIGRAKGSYWEGDIRSNHIFLFSLPDPDNNNARYGLIWKQDNNGTTFICSPVKLDWIDDDCLLPKP